MRTKTLARVAGGVALATALLAGAADNGSWPEQLFESSNGTASRKTNLNGGAEGAAGSSRPLPTARISELETQRARLESETVQKKLRAEAERAALRRAEGMLRVQSAVETRGTNESGEALETFAERIARRGIGGMNRETGVAYRAATAAAGLVVGGAIGLAIGYRRGKKRMLRY